MQVIKNSLLPIYSSQDRIFGLDVIRCLAIVLVIICHSLVLLPAFPLKEIIREYTGTIGVELFFSLSGFLIGTILLKIITKTKQFGRTEIFNFWKRRWLRTLPVFLFYVLIYTIVALFTGYEEFEHLGFGSVISVLLFVQNFLFTQSNYYSVSWSLAIEEWFYLLLPLILSLCVYLFKQTARANFAFTILIIIVAAHFIRLFVFFIIKNDFLNEVTSGIDNFQNRVYVGTRKIIVLRLDAASYGVALAYFYNYYRNKLMLMQKKLLVLGIICFIISCYLLQFILKENLNLISFCLTFSFFGIASTLIIPNFSLINKTKYPPGLVKVIEIISIISYSIYLSHTIFFNLMSHFLKDQEWPLQITALIFIIIVTYIVSVLSYNYIERTGMLIRDKKIHINKKYPVKTV